MNPYSTLKPAWHIDRIQDMRDGKLAAPVSLQLILSDYCNHDCHFCAYRASNGLSSELFGEEETLPTGEKMVTTNPKRMIDKGKAIEILHDARRIGVKSITFTGGGEPTVHPNHLALFRLALSLGFKCSLNTNGIILRDGWEDVLPRFSYIRFSIDAGSAEEYSKVRSCPPAHYEKALRNLARVVEACPDAVVGAGYVVGPESAKNLFRGIAAIRQTGAAYARLACLQSDLGRAVYPGLKWGNCNSVCAESVVRFDKNYQGGEFRVFNLFGQTMSEVMDHPFCGFQQIVLYIGGDLSVYRCCYTAYTELGKIGSLRDQSLRQWFDSPERAELIHGFDARACSTCPLKDKNETIRYLVDSEPLHVDFI